MGTVRLAVLAVLIGCASAPAVQADCYTTNNGTRYVCESASWQYVTLGFGTCAEAEQARANMPGATLFATYSGAAPSTPACIVKTWDYVDLVVGQAWNYVDYVFDTEAEAKAQYDQYRRVTRDRAGYVYVASGRQWVAWMTLR
jgi:hypothetical protein